jgi:lysozyme family protein
MMYEVGGFWKLDVPGVREGLIETAAQRKAVGYTNDPTDRGGETKFGIAKSGNPDLNITTLDWDAAVRRYFRSYWQFVHCDELDDMGLHRLAALHFDSAMNHGVGRAPILLQRAVGVGEDGDIGPATLKAAVSLNEINVCNRLCDIRAQFYKDIVAKKPDQVKYINGWLRRIEEMRAFTTNPAQAFA